MTMTKEELIAELQKFDVSTLYDDTENKNITCVTMEMDAAKAFALKAFEAGEQVQRKKVAKILAEEIHAAEDKKVRFVLEEIVFNLTSPL